MIAPTMFSTVVVDPPWKYADKVNAALTREVSAMGYGADKIRGRRGAEGYYPVMTQADLLALDIRPLVADDAHLYLWTTNAFMVDAHALCTAWGFRQRTILTWVKSRIGMGHYYRNNTEHVLFAVRGRLPVKRHNCPTAFTGAWRRHSQKPDEFYTMVESMSPGPYLDVFARTHRPGWAVWGNEVVSDVTIHTGVPR